MVHSVSGWTRGVQVQLWDPLKTRVIPERLIEMCSQRGAIQIHVYIPNCCCFWIDCLYSWWRHKIPRYTGVAVFLWRYIIVGHCSIPRIPERQVTQASTGFVAIPGWADMTLARPVVSVSEWDQSFCVELWLPLKQWRSAAECSSRCRSDVSFYTVRYQVSQSISFIISKI